MRALAYWIAREGLNLFSRMSDGRTLRGPLYELVRARFEIAMDLDLCSRIYGESGSVRSVFAQFAVLVHEAAQAGDAQAMAIFDRAANELVECVAAVRRSLAVPDGEVIPVSHSGGVFNGATFSRDAFRSALESAKLAFPIPCAAVHAGHRGRAVCGSTRSSAAQYHGNANIETAVRGVARALAILLFAVGHACGQASLSGQ